MAGASYCNIISTVVLAALLTIVFIPDVHAEEVKRWVDEQGRVHFTYQSNNKKNAVADDGAATHDWKDASGRKVFSDRTAKKIKSDRSKSLHLAQCLQGVTEVVTNPVTRSSASGRSTVVLLTAKWCAASNKARAYLKKNKIKFVEYDVDQHRAGRILYGKLSQRGIPTIIAGGQRMFGFRADLAKEILQRSGHLSATKK